MIFAFILILVAGGLLILAWIGSLILIAFTLIDFWLTLIYIKENEERLE